MRDRTGRHRLAPGPEAPVREWAKVYVDLREHPKILAAGDDAGWLYVCAILWSKQHDTDGHVPAPVLPRLTGLGSKRSAAAVERLVETGLFELLPDGWLIHDYLDHQESAEQRRSKRDARSMAGAMGAAKRWHGNGHSEPMASAIANASQTHGKAMAEEEVEEEVTPLVREEGRADVDRLVALLAELMVANNPKAKTSPTSKGWKDPIRLLLDRDGHEPEAVERVIRWCQADDFWRTNILSPSKLRKQFDQLTLKMQASGVRRAIERQPSSADLARALAGKSRTGA